MISAWGKGVKQQNIRIDRPSQNYNLLAAGLRFLENTLPNNNRRLALGTWPSGAFLNFKFNQRIQKRNSICPNRRQLENIAKGSRSGGILCGWHQQSKSRFVVQAQDMARFLSAATPLCVCFMVPNQNHSFLNHLSKHPNYEGIRWWRGMCQLCSSRISDIKMYCFFGSRLEA